jgi:peptide/nickel transport system ATP-binding protein
MDSQQTLLQVRNLKTHFPQRNGIVAAVDGVNFDIDAGQTVGLVGESGCGKSMTARTLMRIAPRNAQISGEMRFRRRSGATIDLAQLAPMGAEMRSIRGAEIAMIFQEPMSSFSPVHTIGNQIGEAVMLHQQVDKAEARRRTLDVLELVGMPNPARNIDRYPHQLSGGMRQRAMIAGGLSCHPALLIADEPTTALDVTTQAQILQLMRDLQAELGMAILFITHDLGVVAQLTQHVLVMYLGQIVESADVKTLFTNPQHPYTQALMRSIPTLKKSVDRLATIPGNVPSPFAMPRGCRFHPRCPLAIPGVCDVQEPPVVEVNANHFARCVLAEPSRATTGAASALSQNPGQDIAPRPMGQA